MRKVCVLGLLVCMLGLVNVQCVKADTGSGELPTIELNPSGAAGGNQAATEPSEPEATAEVVIPGEKDIQEISQAEKKLPVGILLLAVTAGAGIATGACVIFARAAGKRKARQDRQVKSAEQNRKKSEGTGTIWQESIRLTDIADPDRIFSIVFDSTKDKETVLVGSGRTKRVDCKITGDQTVSDLHCKFIKKGRMFYVADLNSTNGTKINGNKIYKETSILSGDTIKIGKSVFRIVINCPIPSSGRVRE